MFSAKTKINLPGEIRFSLRNNRNYECKAMVYVKGKKKNLNTREILENSTEIKALIKVALEKSSRYRYTSRSYRQRVFRRLNLVSKINNLLTNLKISGVSVNSIKRIYKKRSASESGKRIQPDKEKESEKENSGATGLGG